MQRMQQIIYNMIFSLAEITQPKVEGEQNTN